MEFEEEEVIELSVFDDDYQGDDGDEWVEETHHSDRKIPTRQGSINQQDDNLDDPVDDEIEEEEFVDEEYVEEVEEEVWEEDDALSDEQFLNQLHKSFQEMAKKHNHHSSARSNSLASIKEEETTFAADVNGSDETGSFSVDESASVDFDLGSYQDDMSESSHDEPSDYEQACRSLIALVYQGESVDADDIIRRCDLKNLYKNLKQQHKHLLKSKPQNDADNSPWESFNHEVTGFSSNMTITTTSKPPADWMFDDANDLWGFENVQNSTTPSDNDAAFDEANRLPKASRQAEFIQNVTEPTFRKDEMILQGATIQGSPPRQVEKWLERDADDPDDYEYACRKLIAILYKDDEDHDPDTMLRRTQPKDLYRYLKNEYWFLEHTGLIDEKLAAKGAEAATVSAPRLQDMIQSIKRDSMIQASTIRTEVGKVQPSDFEDSEIGDVLEADNDAESPSNETNALAIPGPKVEKWLERNADDPDDFEVACRKLAMILYRDDEDYDVNTMLRRTSPEDLYRYLSNEYWYQVRKGNFVAVDLDTLQVEDNNTLPGKLQETFTALERQLSARIPQSITETDQQNGLPLVIQSGMENGIDRVFVVSTNSNDDVPYVRCGSSGSVGELDEKAALSQHSSANGFAWPTEVPEDSVHALSQRGASWNTLDVNSTNDDSSVESTGIPRQSWSDTYEQPLGDASSLREVTRSLLDPSMSNHDSVEHSIDHETESLSDDIVMPDELIATMAGMMKDGENDSQANMNEESGDSRDETSEKLPTWEVVSGSASTASCNQQEDIESPIHINVTTLPMNPTADVSDLDTTRRLEIIKEEMLLLIRQAEIEELDESFDQSTVNALVLAAQKVAYRKKYYDVFSDKFIFLPPVAKTIMDYSLFDMIEQDPSDELVCLPDVYSASLRFIANKHLAMLQLDFDYMDKLGIPIEEMMGGPLRYQIDQIHSNSMDTESPSQSASTTMSKNDGAIFENENPVERPFPDESGDLPVGPGNFASNQNTATRIETEMRAHGTESQSFDQPIDVDKHRDSNVRSPGTEESLENISATAEHDSSSTRFRELSQILEFKRRMEKSRLSEEVDSLQRMRMDIETSLLERRTRLEEERNRALQEIEESARLLEKKHNSDVEEIQCKLEGLQATRQTAEQEITSRFEELEEKRKSFLAQQTSVIEEERLSEQVALSQKQEEVLRRLLAAQLALETEREAAEEVLLESTAEDQVKTVGLFGVFGQRKRNMELEKQKQRQTNLMQWKLREIELEKEIMDAKIEQAALVDKIKQLEQGSKDLDFELENRRKALEQEILIEEQDLCELSKAIERKFSEGETKLAALKGELDGVYAQDVAWVSNERNNIESKYNDGLLQLAEEEKRQRERVIAAENKINSTALFLKEKWLREEMALAKESEHPDYFEQGSTGVRQGTDRLEYPHLSVEGTIDKIRSFRDNQSNEGNKEQKLDEMALHGSLHIEAKQWGGSMQDQQATGFPGDHTLDVKKEIQLEGTAYECVPTDTTGPDSHQYARRQTHRVFEDSAKELLKEKVERSSSNKKDQAVRENDEINLQVQGRSTNADVPIDAELMKDDTTSPTEAGHYHDVDSDDALFSEGEYVADIAINDTQADAASRQAEVIELSSIPEQDGQLRGTVGDHLMKSIEIVGNRDCGRSDILKEYHNGAAVESVSTQIEYGDSDVAKPSEVGMDATAVEESQLIDRELIWDGVEPQSFDGTAEMEESYQSQLDALFQGVSLGVKDIGRDDIKETKGRQKGNIHDRDIVHLAQLQSQMEHTESNDPKDDRISNEAQNATNTGTSALQEIESDEVAAVHSTSATTHVEGVIFNVGASNILCDVQNADESQEVVRTSGAFSNVEQLECKPGTATATMTTRDWDAFDRFDESGSRSSDDETRVDRDSQNQDGAMDTRHGKQLNQAENETESEMRHAAGADDCSMEVGDEKLDLFSVQPMNNDCNDAVAPSDGHQSQTGEMSENRALYAEPVLSEDPSEILVTAWEVDFNGVDGDDVCGTGGENVITLGDASASTDDDVCQLPKNQTKVFLSMYVQNDAEDVIETKDEESIIPPGSSREGLQALDGATLDGFLMHGNLVGQDIHDEINRVADAADYDHSHDQDSNRAKDEDEGSAVKLRTEEMADVKPPPEVVQSVEIPFTSSQFEQSSLCEAWHTNSRKETLTSSEGYDRIDEAVPLTASPSQGEGFGQNSSTFADMPDIEEHDGTGIGGQDHSLIANSSALVPAMASPNRESAHSSESPTRRHYAGPTHKRKHKHGGGLAGRLLEEAQHFLESSAGSFSQSYANLAPVEMQHVDSWNDPAAIEFSRSSSGPISSPTSPSDQKVLVLLSRTATTRAQETKQDKVLMLLNALRIDVETVDGSDRSHKAVRDTLFACSGLRGVYPQIFVQTNNGEAVFYGCFEELERANEAGQLVQCLEQCASNPHENRQLELGGPQDSPQQTIHEHSSSNEHGQSAQGDKHNQEDVEQPSQQFQPFVMGSGHSGDVIEGSDSVGSTTGSRSATTAESAGLERVGTLNLAKESTSEALFSDSWPVARLEWWRQNGKRLVNEKLVASPQSHVSHAVGSDSSKTSSSLVEKRRLIAERRQRALLARAQISSPSAAGYQHGSHDGRGHAGGRDEETQVSGNEVEVDNEVRVGHVEDTDFPPQSRKISALGPTRVFTAVDEIKDNRMAATSMLPRERADSGKDKEVGKKSVDATRSPVTTSTLDEKRRKAAEARARAMAARSSPRVSSPLSPLGTRADDKSVVSTAYQAALDAKRAERMAEARRLPLNSARARETRLAREAQLLATTQQGTMVKANEQKPEDNIETESLSSGVVSTEVISHEVSKPSLMPQMIREVDRLTTFIVRYEKKLESVCRSILELAQKVEGDEEAEKIQKSTLPEMYRFLSQRDWFHHHSTNDEAPRLFLSTSNRNFESHEHQKDFSRDSCLQLTPLGSSFLAMEGQEESEFGRLLVSIRGSAHTLNQLRHHWADLANRQAGDSLAQTIEGKLEQLVTFGLDARLITTIES